MLRHAKERGEPGWPASNTLTPRRPRLYACRIKRFMRQGAKPRPAPPWGRGRGVVLYSRTRKGLQSARERRRLPCMISVS